MNLFKRALSALVAGGMLLSVGGAFAEGETGYDPQYFTKYDPPITMTTHTVVTPTTLFQDDDTAENNGWTRWQKEHLGIEWKLDWSAPDSATDAQKLDLAFASADMPDFISANPAQIAKYAKAGLLQPLDELIEKYASPLVKWGLQDAVEQTQGAFFKPATVDGKIYAIPVMSDTIIWWNNGFIRMDLLEELGMEMPTTLPELEAVMAAYKEKYPGNYPLAMENTLAAMQIVNAPFKVGKAHWIVKDDDTVGYGSVQPEVKEALAVMADWYQKGYIDPEFVVKDGAKMNESVVAGNFLVYFGSWASIATPFTPMWANVPEADPQILPFLLGEDGETRVYVNSWFTGMKAITTGCKNPEALIYLLNENWDSRFRSDLEIREMMEKDYGYTFKYPVTEERTPINLEEVARDYPNAAQPRELWKYDYPAELEGMGYLNNFYTHYSKLFGFTGEPVTVLNRDLKNMAEAVRTGDMSLLTVNGKSMWDEWTNSNPNMLTNWGNTEAYWSAFEKSGQYVADAFAGASTDLMIEKKAYLDKLELETYTRIIMGTEPLDAFDKFVENWMNNGGSEITVEVNEWYAANNQ